MVGGVAFLHQAFILVRGAFHRHNANGSRQEQLRVTKQLFVVAELLVGQAAKFLPGKTADKEIARDNILVLNATVQRQTVHLARIVADKRHLVL